MIGLPMFEDCQETKGLSGHATCGVCGLPVETVAIVAIIRGRQQQIEVVGLLDEPVRGVIADMDRVFLAVGPCGHTTLDVTDDGLVFQWEAA